jgi:hypothetical protein
MIVVGSEHPRRGAPFLFYRRRGTAYSAKPGESPSLPLSLVLLNLRHLTDPCEYDVSCMNPPPPNILPITGMISTCTNDFKSNPGGSSARRDGRTENLLFSVSNFLRAGKFRLRKRFCFAWDFPCVPNSAMND